MSTVPGSFYHLLGPCPFRVLSGTQRGQVKLGLLARRRRRRRRRNQRTGLALAVDHYWHVNEKDRCSQTLYTVAIVSSDLNLQCYAPSPLRVILLHPNNIAFTSLVQISNLTILLRHMLMRLSLFLENVINIMPTRQFPSSMFSRKR